MNICQYNKLTAKIKKKKITIKSRVRFRVKAAFDFTVAPDFIKSWAYKDVLCSVAQGTLHIHI